ncbi:hypothetical protein [Streptosporangium sp. NPDC000396]|uniref:hypothetical protein n=1 Tax=Streptosporangium sp. NPDC000396 TaxID=3366185 RepID=UPI0036CA12DB
MPVADRVWPTGLVVGSRAGVLPFRVAAVPSGALPSDAWIGGTRRRRLPGQESRRCLHGYGQDDLGGY